MAFGDMNYDVTAIFLNFSHIPGIGTNKLCFGTYFIYYLCFLCHFSFDGKKSTILKIVTILCRIC